MWYYNSPIGTIKIIAKDGRFSLVIKDRTYGSYHSAVAAADDVYHHATGCFEWDSIDGKCIDVPNSLTEWTKSQ